MKMIGLIGGMSWESSIEYYRIINRAVRKRLGSLHSAKSIMVSVDFAEIETLQREARWREAANAMLTAAQTLERGGADFVVLCTNTMHKTAEVIEAGIHIPFLHIADATAEEIKILGLDTVGLLGTKFTMEEDFYRGRLEHRYNLNAIIPDADERQIVHRVIYEELVSGKILPGSREQFRRIIVNLAKKGAQGVILGCTEIGLLVQDADSPIPLFDTTRIHAEAAVDYALAE